jgi:formate hydrogenlyase subunit 4
MYAVELSEHAILVLQMFVLPLIVTAVGIFFGLLYKGIDRKLAAHMQARIGPPIRQPFRDVRKLLIKENIVPENAIPWLFNLMPIVALASAISILFYIPVVMQKPLLHGYGDLILILYLLIIPALALVLGGFASGSPYATVGAQREMVMMMCYEFPLAVVIVALAWKLAAQFPTYPIAAFSLHSFVEHPIWSLLNGPLGFLGAILLLLALFIVTPSELSKIPFDVPEAETEIAGGVLVEYSGRNLALFYLADAVKTVVLGSLIVALFFPYNLSAVLARFAVPMPSGGWLLVGNCLFFLFKLFLVVFGSVIFIRVAAARLKIDQVAYTYFIPVTLLSLCGLVLLVLDGLL